MIWRAKDVWECYNQQKLVLVAGVVKIVKKRVRPYIFWAWIIIVMNHEDIYLLKFSPLSIHLPTYIDSNKYV